MSHQQHERETPKFTPGEQSKPISWRKDQHGYIVGCLRVDNKRRHVRKHRYLVERALGRALLSTEDVHHKNGIKDDNRLENLEVIDHGRHSTLSNYGRIYPRGYTRNLSPDSIAKLSASMRAAHAERRVKAMSQTLTPLDDAVADFWTSINDGGEVTLDRVIQEAKKESKSDYYAAVELLIADREVNAKADAAYISRRAFNALMAAHQKAKGTT